MKKFIAVLLILGLLVGCGSSEDNSSEKKDGISGLKIAAFFPGPRGDSGTVDMIAEAMEDIEKEYGTEIKIVEGGDGSAVDTAKMKAGLLDLSDEKYDLILTNGSYLIDVIAELAPSYPETTYMFFDTVFDFEQYPLENIYAASYKQNEGAFLAGALAMLNSEDDHIGFVGGMENTVILDFLWGYVEGAKYIAPEGTIEVSFTGDWYDSAKAKEIAITEYKMGADVIFPAAGPSSEGVMQAGAEEKFWTVGVDIDRVAQYSTTNPTWAEQVLSSETKNIIESVRRAVELYSKGELQLGKTEYLGVSENGVGLIKGTDYESKNSEEIRNKIDEVEEKIISGEIKVGTAYDKSADEIQKLKDSAK